MKIRYSVPQNTINYMVQGISCKHYDGGPQFKRSSIFQNTKPLPPSTMYEKYGVNETSGIDLIATHESSRCEIPPISTHIRHFRVMQA